MLPDVVGGLIAYTQTQLDVFCTDGEIARYDLQNRPINPESTATNPTIWPAIRIVMVEPGLNRTWTFEDPYDDKGQILAQVVGISRAQVKTTMDSLEALYASISNWAAIDDGGDPSNPAYTISMLLATWWLGQEEGVRLQKGQLLYRGDMYYSVDIHGAVATS